MTIHVVIRASDTATKKTSTAEMPAAPTVTRIWSAGCTTTGHTTRPATSQKVAGRVAVRTSISTETGIVGGPLVQGSQRAGSRASTKRHGGAAPAAILTATTGNGQP